MEAERTSGDKQRRRRGRPPGSISLTPEKHQLLIAAVEAGASDHAAAQAAGIDPRTFRDWRARAEGRHPTRKPTPQLAELFREIDEAGARARISREIVVADRDPKHWLRYKARSKPGLDGWTEPVPEEADAGAAPVYVPTPEEFELIVRALAEAIAPSPRSCGDPACTCALHNGDEHDRA
jgi:hypothetical protein